VPLEVVIGQNATAAVVVENTGTIEGTYSVALRINGTVLETKDVIVLPGSTKFAIFTISRDKPGTYEIKVEDTMASLVVKQDTKTATTSAVMTPTKTTAIINVNIDPNPVTLTAGEIHWKLILTETKGVGVTINSLTRQYYSGSGPLGKPAVFNSATSWFQNLSGSYLPPNKQGIIGAGDIFNSSNFPSYAIDIITGTDDNGHEITATGRVDFNQATTSPTTTTTPTVPKTATGVQSIVVVSFDPNPASYVAGHVYYKVILTEMKGVGVTFKKMVYQGYSNSGPGQPIVYDSVDSFQSWLHNAYLPPNGKASFNAGTASGWTYATYELTGTDDNGNDITVTGRVDFKQ
jgi:hypothetical protein